MAKTCQLTGRRVRSGNNVSHAKNRTKRKFRPNLHTHRIWVPSLDRFVKLTLSAKGLRTLEKRGADAVVRELIARGELAPAR